MSTYVNIATFLYRFLQEHLRPVTLWPSSVLVRKFMTVRNCANSMNSSRLGSGVERELADGVSISDKWRILKIVEWARIRSYYNSTIILQCYIHIAHIASEHCSCLALEFSIHSIRNNSQCTRAAGSHRCHLCRRDLWTFRTGHTVCIGCMRSLWFPKFNSETLSGECICKFTHVGPAHLLLPDC